MGFALFRIPPQQLLHCFQHLLILRKVRIWAFKLCGGVKLSGDAVTQVDLLQLVLPFVDVFGAASLVSAKRK